MPANVVEPGVDAFQASKPVIVGRVEPYEVAVLLPLYVHVVQAEFDPHYGIGFRISQQPGIGVISTIVLLEDINVVIQCVSILYRLAYSAAYRIAHTILGKPPYSCFGAYHAAGVHVIVGPARDAPRCRLHDESVPL